MSLFIPCPVCVLQSLQKRRPLSPSCLVVPCRLGPPWGLRLEAQVFEQQNPQPAQTLGQWVSSHGPSQVTGLSSVSSWEALPSQVPRDTGLHRVLFWFFPLLPLQAPGF